MEKEGNNRLNKKEKMAVAGVVLLLLSVSGITGAWMFYGQSSPTVMVVKSNEPITVLADFSGDLIDTSNESSTAKDSFVFRNENGNVTVNITAESMTEDDPSDDCTDWESDCQLAYYYDDTEISPVEQVTVEHGQHNVTVEYDCVRFACPQNATVNITIAQS